MNLQQYERLLTVCRHDCFQENYRGEVASRMIQRVKERIAVLRGVPLYAKVAAVKLRKYKCQYTKRCYYSLVLCLYNKCEAVLQTLDVDEYIQQGKALRESTKKEYLGKEYKGYLQ